MKKLMNLCLIILSVICCSTLLVGCGKNTDTQKQEYAERIIQAMMTTPNDELYSRDAFTAIGEGVPENAEETEAQKDLKENWNSAVGECFADGALEEFVLGGPATQYLGEADMTKTDISVSEIELTQEEDDTAYYTVTMKAGSNERTEKLFFRFSSEGLVEEVRIM